MLFSIICIALFYGHTHACPAKNIIAPCDCKTFLGSDIMSCNGLLNPDELIKPIIAVAEKRSPIEVLAITNSTLMYIPNSIFKFTKFQKVSFVKNRFFFYISSYILINLGEGGILKLHNIQKLIKLKKKIF